MSLESINKRLRAVRGKALIPEALGDEAVALAADLSELSRRRMQRADRRQGRRMARLLEDPRGKALTLLLADQVFRSHSARRSASQFRHLLRDHGVPRFLPLWERGAMALGNTASFFAPWLVMPMVASKMRAESRVVILPSEPVPLGAYMDTRRQEGIRVNLNQLGEAVLGEEAAARRLDAVIGRLRSPLVGCVSVKLSAIYSQINMAAFDASRDEVARRLRVIFRAAMERPYIDSQGHAHQKFVNLDMEDYQDLQLTIDAFTTVLSEDEFSQLEAGIVLQAYLPDSANAQEQLSAWAIRRVAAGGAGIKLRIVKGANLAMERIEAAQHGWQAATYGRKVDVDANYKKMVGFGCRKENAEAVRLGIASHNLFDVAYAMLAAQMHGTAERVEFEMLEGMANHQAAVVGEVTSGLLIYAPVVRRDKFDSALAYLMRRLDENTADENFLRHMFRMRPGLPSWETEKTRFLDACAGVATVGSSPRRQQDRATEEIEATSYDASFENAPDTDWSLRANREWIAPILKRWQKTEPEFVKLQVDGGEREGETSAEVGDPSRPGHVAYRHALAGLGDIDEALRVAARAFQTWRLKPIEARGRVLREAAAVMARDRGETIGCLVLDGAKTLAEADAEISEAIDFANYYATAFQSEGLADSEPVGRGVVVVAPPWNFPYAIPASGVLAALMAGNTVVLKPAPQAVLSSSRLAHQLWDAGVPRDVLQFLPCPDDEVGKSLITDRRVETVVLTGAYDTGIQFQQWKPDIRLLAETSGKNAMVITAAADVEQAAKDLARSAFGHAGQKCSAASLGLIEAEVYHRLDFRRQLRDAVQSLKVGSAWDLESVVTPLIQVPGKHLHRALTQLDEGEEWLLEPRQIDPDNPCLWSPGIKLGVVPEGEFFRSECFGPVLGLVCVKDLTEAIALQNRGDFGLTGGIQSLDPREIAQWSAAVQVGNAYINRPITGAIVRRQPFGGWGHSAFGPGAKAGGSDYVLAFAHWQQTSLPEQRETPGEVANRFLGEMRKKLISHEDREQVGIAAWNYGWAFRKLFGAERDPSRLPGERNILRYRPHRSMLFRLGDYGLARDCTLAALAAAVTGIPTDLSVSGGATDAALEIYATIPGLRITREGESEFGHRLRALAGEQFPPVIRAPGGVSFEIHQLANAAHAAIITDPIIANGRLELRHWFKEQAVSETTHRHGNILPRFREGQPDESR